MHLLLFATSFVLAFLLFSVQPMATKMVLPTLGGTPAVWNSAMFTFQFLLLGGYAYAHALTAKVSPRWQWRLHAMVIALSCALLPLTVAIATSEAMLANPVAYLVAAFVVQLGLPFFALAATQPLLQSWLARSGHRLAATPYVLYSASNLGSFGGLIGYVALVEPMLPLDAQRVGWSYAYVLGMALLLVAGQRLGMGRQTTIAANETSTAKPGWRRYALWIFLAFLPSSLSLGVTTYITTDIASVPLLWVMPLSLYLLSFVDAFRVRPLLVPAAMRMAPLLALGALVAYGLQAHRFAFGFPLHLLSFAALAFAIHGWLARSKPEAAQLTRFYLCLSLGGALGGMFNGLLAPMLLREPLEYPLVLLLASVTAFVLAQRAAGEGRLRPLLYQGAQVLLIVLGLVVVIYLGFKAAVGEPVLGPLDSKTLVMAASGAGLIAMLLKRQFTGAFFACASVVLMLMVALAVGASGHATLFKDRNFFGTERVYENAKLQARYIMHDTTLHGVQSLRKADRLQPLSYYGGLGALLKNTPAMRGEHWAVVGLGIGNLKCYARPDQTVDFFEINPMVKELAEDTRFFTQLRDCAGDYTVKLGDGRILMAQEPDGKYGAIILDAFSSDAIPGHLLTREALAIYRSKLAPGGILLIHTTNRHIDLWPLLAAQAKEIGMQVFGKRTLNMPQVRLSYDSFWVAMADDPAVVTVLADEGWVALEAAEGEPVWTDQYINILTYLKAFR